MPILLFTSFSPHPGVPARKPSERCIEEERRHTGHADSLASLAMSWPQKEKRKRLNSKSDTALGRTHMAGHSVTVKLFMMSRDKRHHTKE